MNKYEYIKISKQGLGNGHGVYITLDELNELGNEGWELTIHDRYGDFNEYTFKRIKK